MQAKYYLTVLGSAAAAVLPVVTPIIPAPFNFVVSGLLTAVFNYYHLNQPAPH